MPHIILLTAESIVLIRGLLSEGWYFVLSGVVVVLTGGLVVLTGELGVLTRVWLYLQVGLAVLTAGGDTCKIDGCTHKGLIVLTGGVPVAL